MSKSLDPRFQESETREDIIDELVYLEWSVFGALKRIEHAIDAGLLVGYVTVSGEYADPYGHAARLDQSYGRSLQARARLFQREDLDAPSLLEQLVYPVQSDETPATSPILRYLKQDILPLACLRFLTRSRFWARRLSASFLPMHPVQHVLAFLEQRGREQPEQVADHLVMLSLRMNRERDLFHLMKGEQLMRLHERLTEKLKELHEGPISDNTVWRLLCIMFGEWVSPYGALIGDIEAEEPSWERGVLTAAGAKMLGYPHRASCMVDYEPHPSGGFTKSIYHQGEYIGGILQIGKGGILPEESGV
jgi:hypothetical protein